MSIISKLAKVNKQITATEVRLVDTDGSQLGVMSISAALSIAQSRGLDLVEISPTAVPPVCKILDFVRFRYEEKKRMNEAKKKQKTFDIKEIRFRPGIGINDLNVKIKHIRGFIDEGHHVKVSLMYKGREGLHKEYGMNIFKKLVEDISDISKPQTEPKLMGNVLSTKFVPLLLPQKKIDKTQKLDGDQKNTESVEV